MLNTVHWNRSLLDVVVQACLCAFQKLILSETSIFDVLPNFFYHSNQVVRMAALEVSFHSNTMWPFSWFLADFFCPLGYCISPFYLALRLVLYSLLFPWNKDLLYSSVSAELITTSGLQSRENSCQHFSIVSTFQIFEFSHFRIPYKTISKKTWLTRTCTILWFGPNKMDFSYLLNFQAALLKYFVMRKKVIITFNELCFRCFTLFLI